MIRPPMLISCLWLATACGGSNHAPVYLPEPRGTAAATTDPATGGEGNATGAEQGNTGKTGSDPAATTHPQDNTINQASDPCAQVVDQCPVAGGVTWQCKKRFMHGVNYAWHNFGADFGGISNVNFNQPGVSTTVSDVDTELTDVKDHGGGVVNWFVLPDFRGNGVAFDAKDLPSGLAGTMQADLLKALELADKNDLYLKFTMFSYDAFKPTYTTNGVKVRSLQPLVVDTSKRQALLDNVIRPMVKIIENSPYKKRMMSWELMNEPESAIKGEGTYGDPAYECNTATMQCVTHDQMESFFADIIKVIRAESKALVTVGSPGFKWKNAWTRLDLDYYSIHFYDSVNADFPYTKTPAELGFTSKPVVIGAFFFDGITGVDGATLRDTWYRNGYGGAMGWQVTDPSFNWATNRDNIKAFADNNSCQTHF